MFFGIIFVHQNLVYICFLLQIKLVCVKSKIIIVVVCKVCFLCWTNIDEDITRAFLSRLIGTYYVYLRRVSRKGHYNWSSTPCH